MFDKFFGNLNVDMARRLVNRYERSPVIPTPIMSEEAMKEQQKGAIYFIISSDRLSRESIAGE